MAEQPVEQPIEYYNEGSKYMVEQWNGDWKLFFADICAKTGLTLAQAMQFHIVLSAFTTRSAVAFLAEKASQGRAKEPWEE